MLGTKLNSPLGGSTSCWSDNESGRDGGIPLRRKEEPEWREIYFQIKPTLFKKTPAFLTVFFVLSNQFFPQRFFLLWLFDWLAMTWCRCCYTFCFHMFRAFLFRIG